MRLNFVILEKGPPPPPDLCVTRRLLEIVETARSLFLLFSYRIELKDASSSTRLANPKSLGDYRLVCGVLCSLKNFARARDVF